MAEYVLYLDESGDHSLSNINQDFPVFILCGLLFEKTNYKKACEELDALKKKYFDTTDVIMHNRDIRKCEGPFRILFNLDVKKKFYADLDRVLSNATYVIIASAINKEKHIAQYGKLADDPYEIGLTFVLERTLFEADKNRNTSRITVTIEGRGQKEDQQIARRYNELLYRGTSQIESDRLLRIYDKELIVRKKRDNDCGLQLADLCAYPIARYVLKNSEPNPAFDIIKPKIRSGPKGFIGYGIKIFPYK
jgi:hypothetical protein